MEKDVIQKDILFKFNRNDYKFNEMVTCNHLTTTVEKVGFTDFILFFSNMEEETSLVNGDYYSG